MKDGWNLMQVIKIVVGIFLGIVIISFLADIDSTLNIIVRILLNGR